MNPQAVMDRHAKSFSWAARFLAPAARREAAELYVFARVADDLADEAELGTPAERLYALNELRTAALAPGAGHALGHRAGQLLARHGVQSEVIAYFMDCLQLDSGPRHIQSSQELLQFAYGVAGTVGQMMCPILGADDAAQKYAMALGVAMQLTNIARDVVEDAQRGRCYLPAEWGVQPAMLQAPANDAEARQAFVAIERILLLADDFYSYARQGLHAIPPGNRRAIRIALALYRGIGIKIARRGHRQYWHGRTSLGNVEKLRLVLGSFTGNMTPASGTRDVVAHDLRHLARIPGFPQSA